MPDELPHAPAAEPADGKLKIYFLPNLMTAGNLFCGFVALTKIVEAAGGTPAFHRVAEIHFPSMHVLQACAESQAGRDALAHAHKISNGGAPSVLIAEEDVVKLGGS